MPYARIDSKERFRLPRAVREALDIHAGDAIAYSVVDGELRVRKAEDPYADWGPVARAVLRYADEHPERVMTLEESMAKRGITHADLDALEPEPGIDA